MKVVICKDCQLVLPSIAVNEWEDPKLVQYCPRCGKSTKQTTTKEYNECFSHMAAVYGPPYDVTHTCSKCGRKYRESGLGGPNYHYCPHCGTPYGDERKK